MTELFLEYTDNLGDERHVPVSGERCFVGRNSASDIWIPDGRLSRRHLQIERVGDAFIATDAGSSNGTVLNGSPLTDAAVLTDGDVLDLGGFKLNIVLKAQSPRSEPARAAAFDEPAFSGAVDAPVVPEAVGPSVQPDVGAVPPSIAQTGSGSILLWIVIPAFGLIFVLFAGLVVFLLVSSSTTTVAKKQNDVTYLDDDVDTDSGNKKSSNKTESGNSGTTTSSGSSNTAKNNDNSLGSNTSTTNLSATAKIEQNGAAFLRRIAHNDPRAFLTTEQAGRLSSKIKQLSGNSAVADNLNSARKNAAQIKSLAESKSLKPQFLAIAAVAKLGGSRGDVLQTAQGMTEILDKLTTHLGNELADDSLLVIAAYGQGAAGETMKMRNMLQELANKSPESSRAIRTIWFLQKNGKITQAEFENALNFLAIGTISQSPKDFGVNAEALVL